MPIYLDLTRQFNRGRTRAILSSGQAVVMHGLAIMSKDGDWIILEDQEATAHILDVLASHSAHYRFGAPFDVRWMRGGWSAHFQFFERDLRVRTDFVTRPPRLDSTELDRMWQDHADEELPVLGPRRLAEIKKTDREKDYPVIGELARLLVDPREQLLYSRSARDLLQLADQYPDLVAELAVERPVLAQGGAGRDALEQALDQERRHLMRRNEERLQNYIGAAREWAAAWPQVASEIAGLALLDAHEIVVRRAEGTLPFAANGPSP